MGQTASGPQAVVEVQAPQVRMELKVLVEQADLELPGIQISIQLLQRRLLSQTKAAHSLAVAAVVSLGPGELLPAGLAEWVAAVPEAAQRGAPQAALQDPKVFQVRRTLVVAAEVLGLINLKHQIIQPRATVVPELSLSVTLTPPIPSHTTSVAALAVHQLSLMFREEQALR
jgi:hypothetical protein